MNYRPELKDIRYLACLQGDFELPVGKVEERDGLHFFAGDGYEWSSETTAHPSGVFKRVDKIKNVSDRPLALRTALSRFSFPGGEYEVYTQYNEWCGEGQGNWSELTTEISAEGESVRSNSGASPFVALYSKQTSRGMVFHILQNGLWMLKVKRFFKSGVDKRVEVELGLLSRGLNYVLAPGEELTLPAILYYEFYNKLDLDAYRLHRYCNDTYPARSMPVIYNTWLSRFDDISYDILAQQLDYVKRLGAEYFVIDAGWFGPPHTWSASVGDWEECKTASMAGRMREFSDLVRAKGLKFGLWFEPERATRMARAPKEHPDYYFFEGSDYFLDFGNPEAWEYIYDIVTTRIRQYGIEFIKFDFNAEMTYDRRGEAFIPYFRGYKKFVAAIRKEFPDIYLENCASGGERMTMSSLFDGFDSFWASDNHSIYKQVEMYRSNLMYMPSRAIEKWVTVQSMKDFGPVYGNYEKYSDPIIGCAEAAWRNVEGLTRDYLMTAIQGGPLGFSCDLTRWSERLLADMSAFVAAYKEERAFWMRSECHVLCATESVLALQFNDEEFRKIKLCVFLDKPIQYEFNVHPFCDCDATFVTEDGRELDAQTLCHEGISFGSWDRFCGVTVTLNRK